MLFFPVLLMSAPFWVTLGDSGGLCPAILQVTLFPVPAVGCATFLTGSVTGQSQDWARAGWAGDETVGGLWMTLPFVQAANCWKAFWHLSLV